MLSDVDIARQVEIAFRQRVGLTITGANTAQGARATGSTLSLAPYTGIVDYAPNELVLIARAGTPVSQIDALLAAHGQWLAFEPPRVEARSTIGAVVARGFSGPARSFRGSLRDFVLGVDLVTGHGRIARVGGRVVKNVAGYDVSRLMVGARGELGVLLSITLRVLPRAACEQTRALELTESEALEWCGEQLTRSAVVSATSWSNGILRVRLSGAESMVAKALREWGGVACPDGATHWCALRDRRTAFFHDQTRLWRIRLPAGTPALSLPGSVLHEGGGTQRWWLGPPDIDPAPLVGSMGGMVDRPVAVLRHGNHAPVADRAFLALQRELRAAFDPAGIFNRDTVI